ncbi:MAG: hypothetical protein ACLUI5_05705 [Fusicatenibacter saccharivorans]
MMLQTLKGYKVVYNIKGYDITAGNSQIFPKRHIAEIYKWNYESHPWFHEELIIREADYEGVPLSESIIINGKNSLTGNIILDLMRAKWDAILQKIFWMSFLVCCPLPAREVIVLKLENLSHIELQKMVSKSPPMLHLRKSRLAYGSIAGDCFRGENVCSGIELPYL